MPTDLPKGKPPAMPAQEPLDRTGIVLNWMALFVAVGLCFWTVSAVSFDAVFRSSEPPAVSLPADEP